MPTINMHATGDNIRRMRKNAGMTIADVQMACGVTAAAVCKWQRGDAMPTIDNLVILAAVWGVKIDDILVVSDNRKTGAA